MSGYVSKQRFEDWVMSGYDKGVVGYTFDVGYFGVVAFGTRENGSVVYHHILSLGHRANWAMRLVEEYKHRQMML